MGGGIEYNCSEQINVTLPVQTELSLQNSYIKALTPNMTVFGDGHCKEIIQVK